MGSTLKCFLKSIGIFAHGAIFRMFSSLKLECGPMPNVIVALPNVGGALCSMPQIWLMPTTRCRAVMLPTRESR